MYRIIALLVFISLAGCSSLIPVQQTEASFVIYDVQPASVSRGQLLDAITDAVRRNESQIRVTRDIQTGDLPDKPGRFTIKDPYGGTNLGAMMSASGHSMKIPVCDGSILTLASGNASGGGDSTSFFLCVIPYKAGYSVNIYATYSSTRGGISPGALADSLVRSVAGDRSQYIPRAMNDVRTAAEGVGGKVSVIDSYIPESFKGIFADKTASLNQ